MKIIIFILKYTFLKYLCRYRKFREKYIAFIYKNEVKKQKGKSKIIYKKHDNASRNRSEKTRL